MIEGIVAHIERYEELCALYHFIARKSAQLVRDESGAYAKKPKSVF